MTAALGGAARAPAAPWHRLCTHTASARQPPSRGIALVPTAARYALASPVTMHTLVAWLAARPLCAYPRAVCSPLGVEIVELKRGAYAYLYQEGGHGVRSANDLAPHREGGDFVAKVRSAEFEMYCMRQFGRVGLSALTLLRCDGQWVEHRRVRADVQAEQALHRAQAPESGRRGREAAGGVFDGYSLRRGFGCGERHRILFPSFQPLLKDGRPDRLVELFVCVLLVIERHESDRRAIVADPHRGHVTLERVLSARDGARCSLICP